MSKATEPQKDLEEEVMVAIPKALAVEIRKLSQEMGVDFRTMLGTLLWLGKNAVGREVTISSRQETKQIVFKGFEKFKKLTNIDKT